jgi:hypothetical protein
MKAIFKYTGAWLTSVSSVCDSVRAIMISAQWEIMIDTVYHRTFNHLGEPFNCTLTTLFVSPGFEVVEGARQTIVVTHLRIGKIQKTIYIFHPIFWTTT